MEKIRITNEYIDFSGFSDIIFNITICLYDAKLIIIQLGHNPGICRHCVTLNEQYYLEDINMVHIFEGRKVTNNTRFLKRGNYYYQVP